jgi:hypothetical protein
MKTLTGISVLIILSIFIQSCGIYEPISTKAPANNESYQVDYLFEHEGIKVYRFLDRGRWVYFTNCAGDLTSFQNDSVRITNTIRKIPAESPSPVGR